MSDGVELAINYNGLRWTGFLLSTAKTVVPSSLSTSVSSILKSRRDRRSYLGDTRARSQSNDLYRAACAITSNA